MDPEEIQSMFLSMEEFEALRLRYYLDLKQTEAADKMQISQTTYSRILTKTFKKITQALVEGYSIVIQTQNSQPSGFGRVSGQGSGHGTGSGQGQGRRRRQGGQGSGVERELDITRNLGDTKLGLDEYPMNNRPEKPKVVFKGYGCLKCGYIFQIAPESNSEAFPIKTEKSLKPTCPECNSPKTYRLIKKLTPDT